MGGNLYFDEEDIDRFKKAEGAWYIMEHVLTIPPPPGEKGARMLYEGWRNPRDGDELSWCPWLVMLPYDGWTCSIYPDRPNCCREYPGKQRTQLCIDAGVPFEAIGDNADDDEDYWNPETDEV